MHYDEDATLVEMYRLVFDDRVLFKKFLCFAKENEFSCITTLEDHTEDTALYLYICDCLRTMTSEKVSSLLEISKPDIKKQMQQSIEGTNVTLLQALKAAVYLNIPVNERGEVIYLVWRARWWYEVFSYESSFHRVDNKGKIIRENTKNQTDRVQVLETIRKFKRFQVLVDAHTIEDENDIRLATVMMQSFETETGECWQKIVWDTREENVYRQRLNSYVFFKILDLEKEFKRLQQEDASWYSNTAWVWGVDLWDGEWVYASPEEVKRNRAQIKVVK